MLRIRISEVGRKYDMEAKIQKSKIMGVSKRADQPLKISIIGDWRSWSTLNIWPA